MEPRAAHAKTPHFLPLGLPAQVILCDCCCIHGNEPLQMPSTRAPLTGWLACMDGAWALPWLVLSAPGMGSGSPLQKTQLAVCPPPIMLTPAVFHMTGLVLQDPETVLLYSECQCQNVSLTHMQWWYLSMYLPQMCNVKNKRRRRRISKSVTKRGFSGHLAVL